MIPLSILLCSATLLVLTTIFMLFKVLIKPYLGIQFYKKQGFEAKFIPIIGYINQSLSDLDKHGDFYYSFKPVNMSGPKPKGTTSCFADTVQIYLLDPLLIKEFYKSQENYVKSQKGLLLAKMLAKDGLVFGEGQVWKKHRKLSSSLFSYDAVAKMVPQMVRSSEEIFNQLHQTNDLTKVDIKAQFQLITGDIVGKVFFGMDLNKHVYEGKSLTSSIIQLFEDLTEASSDPLTLLLNDKIIKMGLFPRHRKLLGKIVSLRKIIDQILNKEIEAIMQKRNDRQSMQDQKGNLLTLFVEEQMKIPTETAFTNDEMIDEFLTYILAGIDTTVNFLSQMAYFYKVNPHCHNKIKQETNLLFSAGSSEVTIEKLNRLDYMTAFIKEALRVATPAASLFPRLATRDHHLGSLIVKKGTIVNVPVLSNHYDPQFYEDAELFKPERWLDENSQTKRNVQKISHIFTPFATGPRNCIGHLMAIVAAKVIFALMVRKFEYSFTDEGYLMKFVDNLVLSPYETLLLSMKPINS